MSPAPEHVALKERFAEAFLRDPDPMRAALAVVGQADVPLAMAAALRWPTDPFVLDCQSRLIAEFGIESFLPDKMLLARTIWNHAERCRDEDSKTKALKLYGEVTGIINRDRQGPSSIIDNRTMIIYDCGSKEEWAKNMRAQQDRLLIEASQE